MRSTLGDGFHRAATRITRWLGSLPALGASVVAVLLWAVTGPLFHFSDTWQLVINTATTIATFWMVFVIQNTTNRESQATRLQLDELIRAMRAARNEFLALEDAPEAQLVHHEREFAGMAARRDPGAPASTARTASRGRRRRSRGAASGRRR
jgi:low affinity Fe/Cu permease